MASTFNGVPYPLAGDPVMSYPATGKALAQYIDANFPRDDDPRLSDARTPRSHVHQIGQVTGLQAALNGKASATDSRLTDARTPKAHKHPMTDVTGLADAINGKADQDDPRLSDARTPTAHHHALGDVTGLQAALDGKADEDDPRLTDKRAPTAHTHPVGDVTGLAARLAALEPAAPVGRVLPLSGPWRDDVNTSVIAYRTGHVVTISAWRLAATSGMTGEVTAYIIPEGLRPPPLYYATTTDSRGSVVTLGVNNAVVITDPSAPVAHHSFTYVCLDPVPSPWPGTPA